MKLRKTQVLIAALSGAVLLFYVLPQGMRAFESRTRASLLAVVARELPRDAAVPDIKKFLAQHAEAVDDRQFRDDEIIGIVRQTALDHFLLDRQVQIVFKIDSGERLSDTEIRFYYTFL